MQGRTLGLVGFGRIARAVARKLSGFAMRVLAFDPMVNADEGAKLGATMASLDEVLAQADAISIHCPLTPETRHSIGESAIRKMKPTAVLINTARGPVIDETALTRALTEGWIAGAGLDVLEQEPATPTHPLLHLDNVVITPHIASQTATGLHLPRMSPRQHG